MVPSITLSEDTLSALERLARPFVDTTPEHVIRRLLDKDDGRGEWGKTTEEEGESGKLKRTRISSDQKVPQSEYREPILEALAEMGGRGTREEVLQRVEERMQHRFTPADEQSLPVSPELRWKKSASWERMQMVDDGLLRDDSPRGVWELSDRGWEEARKLSPRREG